MLVARTFTVIFLAAHSEPGAAQTATPKQSASAPGAKATDSQLESAVSRFSRREEELPKGPTPRTETVIPIYPAIGYIAHRQTCREHREGSPGYKLPFTQAGRKALKYNVDHTRLIPRASCIVGGIPRHDASALPFQLLESSDHIVFLYWYTTYSLIPTDGRKHNEDPDPSFFGDRWAAGTATRSNRFHRYSRTHAPGPTRTQIRIVINFIPLRAGRAPTSATCTSN